MMKWIARMRTRLILLFAIVGPGIITAVADNDAAGVSTYTVAAATFGYQMLIILIPMAILLALTQEIGARIAIVAQKGLADLIRERFGIRTAIFMYGVLFVVNLTVVVMDVSGLKAALVLFHLNPYIFLPAIIVALFLFVVLAHYNTIERFFLVLVGFYITYVASAFLAKPDWPTALTSLVIPHGQLTARFLYVAIAVLGTTITAWGQFFINSYVKDKHITTENLKYNRAEVYIGSLLTHTLIFFTMVAVTATLFSHNIPITNAASASIAIQPFAGVFAGTLFAFGLLFAGVLGCIVVALTTAYAFSEFFGYSGSLDEGFRKSRLFYVTLLIQLGIASIVALLPNVSLFTITLAANFVNGIVLPVVFYFLYQFANSPSVMGEHVNTRWQNILLGSSAVVITFASVLGVVGQVLGW